MPRYATSFTLDIATIQTIQSFAADQQKVAALLPSLMLTPSLVDKDGLTAENYATLYALLPVPPPSTYVQDPRQPCLAALTAYVNRVGAKRYGPAILAEQARLQKANRALLHTVRRGRAPTVSRVVEALILSAIAVVEERVSRNSELKGSARSNAGQGQHQSTHTSRRKAAAV